VYLRCIQISSSILQTNWGRKKYLLESLPMLFVVGHDIDDYNLRCESERGEREGEYLTGWRLPGLVEGEKGRGQKN